MNSQRIRLWDLPTRLFHWLLVLAVVAAVVSGQVGGKLIDLHGKIGLAIVGLIAFRVVWGFVGSTYARFAQFLPTPARIRAYLKGEWRGLGFQIADEIRSINAGVSGNIVNWFFGVKCRALATHRG